MSRLVCIAVIGAVLSTAPLLAAGAATQNTSIFHCTVEDVSDLLSSSPFESDTVTGPHSVFSEFEFDTASGLLRWKMADGTFDVPIQYKVIQEGSDANDWVAVPAPPFQPDEFGRVWNSTSFLRIRNWELPGAQEKGRFFMVQNISDVIVGHCEPR